MGSGKSQTVGYKYFAGLMVVIGNRIEKLININPDNRGWIIDRKVYPIADPLELTNHSKNIHAPDLFGGDKQEGGWVGVLDHHMGMDNQQPNDYLQAQIGEDISAYPNLSYLVFRGMDTKRLLTGAEVELGPSINKGFHLVSMSGMMKDFLLWPKRTRIRNDGSEQWYKVNSKSQVVCEIDAMIGTSRNNHDIDDLQPLTNEWFGTTFAPGYPEWNVFPNTGLIIGYVCDFASQFGPDHPTGKVKTNFTGTNLSGLVIRLILKADNRIDFVNFAGDYSLKQEWSEVGYEVCREYELTLNGSGSNELIMQIRNYRTQQQLIRHSVVITCEPLRYKEGNYEALGVDINPIHKIREILTDYIAMGRPESEINDENFKVAADRIYDEGLGVSWAVTEKSCKEALDELCYHIEAGLRVNRQTGLFEVILFRDDLLGLDKTVLFNKSNIKSFSAEVLNADDMINMVNINYYDRELIKDSSFSIYDNGLVHTIGHENAETLGFPYFMRRYNAEMVANWKLKQLSTPAWKGSFTTGFYDARKLNRYDVIKITWPEYNINNLAVRIMKIDLGDGVDNTVTIEWVEVVPYSSAGYASIGVDDADHTSITPQLNINAVFEMPYLEAVHRNGQLAVDQELVANPELGYLMAVALKPQNNSINALLYTDGGTGTYTDLEKVSVMDYCKGAYLDGAIGYLDTTFAIKPTELDKSVNLSSVHSGSWLQLNDEIMVFVSYDNDTNLITVKRGALDTVPQQHESGVLFFWDDNAGVDPTTYADGETVKAQVLTTTPSGTLPLNPGATKQLEIVGRAIRPYPPANVKINSEYYPPDAEILVLTWKHRNRLQQTGGELLGWTDASVTLETGVTYQLEVYEINADGLETEMFSQNIGAVDTYTVDLSASNPATRQYRIVLIATRDGFESYQSFEHVLSTAFSAPYNLTAEYIE